ncbi:MAG: ABC transporter ATP-binding protein [Spirochaetota bacterium]
MQSKVIELSNLKTFFKLDEGILKAVDGVSFRVQKQQTLGLIGESGCGKSVTAQSILRIVPPPGNIFSGEIILHRERNQPLNLVELNQSGKEIRKIRGKEISMIFQEPMTSLSPVHTVGKQIVESILLHHTRNKNEAKEIALEMLANVGIPNSSQRFYEYPHQLSGGLRQRVMIAMALSCHPSLLIADEPTTALDVTVQAQILELIKKFQDRLAMAVLYITHDLGVMAEIADEIAVMYLGKIVEYGGKRDILKDPLHPYTDRLLKSIPRIGRKARVRLDAIEGTVPLPIGLPEMCRFYSRCPRSIEGICNKQIPSLLEIKKGHLVRCFLFHREKEEDHE